MRWRQDYPEIDRRGLVHRHHDRQPGQPGHPQPRFEVFILPNLYGDIITDEAAQIQGGVGTAGSANTRQPLCHVRGHPRHCAPACIEDG